MGNCVMESDGNVGHDKLLQSVAAGHSRLNVMAVASCGGHWVQLRKLSSAFDGYQISYVTVSEDYRSQVNGAPFYSVVDASLSDRLKLLVLAIQMACIVLRVRPDVVISTGAAPGFFALLWGKLFIRARTIWVDSVANSEQLSASGRYVGRFADLWLTQWKHLQSDPGPRYEGAIL